MNKNRRRRNRSKLRKQLKQLFFMKDSKEKSNIWKIAGRKEEDNYKVKKNRKWYKTLNCLLITSRDSLEPILEKYSITFESHSLFLDSSNTPLPLAFETFPLSGSILHVKGKAMTMLFCWFYMFTFFHHGSSLYSSQYLEA